MTKEQTRIAADAQLVEQPFEKVETDKKEDLITQSEFDKLVCHIQAMCHL